jgi:hypothetical protein
MSKASERQAWTKFVEEREAKRPRIKKRVKEEASQAESRGPRGTAVLLPQWQDEVHSAERLRG